MNYQIKEQMKEEFKTEISNGSDLDTIRDNSGEWIDGYLPVYYNQIVQEWQEMPSEYNDRGAAELGINKDNENHIYNLMSLDLYLYYNDIFNKAIEELEEELESAE
jgi:flavodoxin